MANIKPPRVLSAATAFNGYTWPCEAPREREWLVLPSNLVLLRSTTNVLLYSTRDTTLMGLSQCIVSMYQGITLLNQGASMVLCRWYTMPHSPGTSRPITHERGRSPQEQRQGHSPKLIHNTAPLGRPHAYRAGHDLGIRSSTIPHSPQGCILNSWLLHPASFYPNFTIAQGQFLQHS